MPRYNQVVVDQALTNVSVKYTNEEYIADLIFPVFRVGKQTGKYYVYDKSNLRPEKSLRGAGSPSNEVDFGVSPDGTYSCDDHALKSFVPQEIQDQADAAINVLIDETEAVTEKLLIEKEQSLAAIVTSGSNITQTVALSSTDQWSDMDNSDPIGDIRTAKATIHAAVLKTPNVLVLGKQVFDQLCDHPQIVERVKYSQLGVITEELMARVFGVDKIIVGKAGYNSAAEGQTDTIAYIWGKNALLAFVNPSMGLKKITLGLTMTYKTRITERWDDRDRRGTYIRVGDDFYDQKLVCAAAGYLITTAVA